jgi:membrane-bound lytic murein transglycosylase F
MLMRKSQPEYFNDPVVKLGYCKCTETVHYVREVLNRYDMYTAHISGIPVAGN